MASPKRFPTLVQLGQQDELFELKYLDKQPFWFNSEHLINPHRVHLEEWLVEAIFGPCGEHIQHVECVSRTILRVRRLAPRGDAEVLIFGRPSYQQDVAKLITNLADYHRQRRAQSLETSSAREEAGIPEAAGAAPQAPDAAWMWVTKF